LPLANVNSREISHDPDLEGHMIFEQLVTHIPEKWRVPLVMKEMDNFSFAEIAQILNKPLGTVKSMVFRGKAYLKKQYRDPQGATHV
jgi:RNA polymerase sigma-70 factor (ECF subfamily)